MYTAHFNEPKEVFFFISRDFNVLRTRDPNQVSGGKKHKMAAKSYLCEAGVKQESVIFIHIQFIHLETQTTTEHCHILVRLYLFHNVMLNFGYF